MILALFTFFYAFLYSPSYEVEYAVQTKGLSHSYYFNGVGILKFDKNNSIYNLRDYPTQNVYPDNSNRMGSEEDAYVTPSMVILGDPEGLPIYRDFITDSVWFVPLYNSRIFHYIFTEPSVMIDWKISGENRDLLGFTCYKAEGYYFGRKYIAWFTPEIPIPAGPYQFWGCPGLILELNSTDGQVSFQAISVSKLDSDKCTISKPNHYPIVDLEKLKKIVWDFEVNFRLENPLVSNVDPPAKCYIEINKWNIYSEFNEWWDGKNKK